MPMAGAASGVLQGLAPLVDARCRLLVLGSFPGARSLALQQYYAHPQNQFWRIFMTIFNVSPHVVDLSGYQNKSEWLRNQGVGLWDVYARCERQGSLDSAIRHAEPNDLSRLRGLCPALRLVAHNGAESHRHASASAVLGVPVLRLPSTSPAYAGMRFEDKCAAWAQAARRAGLIHSPP